MLYVKNNGLYPHNIEMLDKLEKKVDRKFFQFYNSDIIQMFALKKIENEQSLRY